MIEKDRPRLRVVDDRLREVAEIPGASMEKVRRVTLPNGAALFTIDVSGASPEEVREYIETLRGAKTETNHD